MFQWYIQVCIQFKKTSCFCKIPIRISVFRHIKFSFFLHSAWIRLINLLNDQMIMRIWILWLRAYHRDQKWPSVTSSQSHSSLMTIHNKLFIQLNANGMLKAFRNQLRFYISSLFNDISRYHLYTINNSFSACMRIEGVTVTLWVNLWLHEKLTNDIWHDMHSI